MSEKQTVLEELVRMSRAIGQPEQDHVILGEGNTSARASDETFFVKASGEQLGLIEPSGFVEINTERALGLLDGDDLEGDALKDALTDTKVDPDTPGRPSVEVLMHVVALQAKNCAYVGHTHTTAVTGLLCSDRAEAFTHARLFPDQIVLCGPDSAFVPYVAPGLPLGRAVHESIAAYEARYAIPPQTIMLKNHGVVVLGQTAREVEQILAMCTKAAHVYARASAPGEPVTLSETEIDHIYNRADEHYRRARLVGA